MTSINRLTVKSTPVDNDLFPIWDSESSRTRSVTYKAIKEHLSDLSAGTHVESGVYSSGTLTLKLNDNTEVVITGWKDLSGVTFSDDGAEVGNFSSVNFKGNGIQVSHTGGELQVEVDRAAVSPTLALQFSGIYSELQDLKDAIPKPSDHQQAIVIRPSEKYYHSVGGTWVELAPVGSFHPNYLGAYDTVDDLKAAEPTPNDESLAIVGTTAKSFYIYTNSQWEQVTHTDLPSLDARLTDAEAKVASNINRIQTAEGHLQTLQTGQQVLQSNIDQKISGIHLEDTDGNAFDDINGIVFDGAEVQDDQGSQTSHVVIKPKITVANGQQPGSTSLTGNAIIFEGSQVSADPNDSNVIKVGVQSSHRGISVGDGSNASREVTRLLFNGHQAFGTGDTAEIHLEFAHFKTIAERDAWSVKFKDHMDYDLIALVDADENGFVAYYRFDAATKSWKDYDAQGVVMSDSNGAIPKNIKTVVFGPGFEIQQAGDQEDAALVTYTHSAGIDGIVIDGHKVDEFGLGPNLQLDSPATSPRLLVNPRSFENQHAASCLLQLDSDVTVQSGHATKLYTSHEVIPTGEYFSLNQIAHGVNVQDNTGGDTAVTGGELTRIMASVGFYGDKATDDCNVKIWAWYKDPTSPLAGGILSDVNGKPMVVERSYNAGDVIREPLIITGAMMATGNAPIVLYIEASGGDWVINPDQTLICIEQFTDGFETSLASIEFERRIGVEINAEIKQFKTKMLSMKEELLGVDEPEATISAHTGYDYLNEFGVQNLTAIKASISGGVLQIKDNGVPADTYVDVYLDSAKTTMLRGRVIDYDVTIANPQDAWRLEVYKWTGKADRAGRVYDSRNNGALNLNDGFELVKSKFIAENADGSFKGYLDTTTVPDDAVNLFIILRPVDEQDPIDLSMKDFTWGVANPFRGYTEVSQHSLHENHLRFSENWAEFYLNNQGYPSIRYTINNAPSSGNPMPVGVLGKGRAPVEIDTTVNKVSGSADPQNDGAIKFLKDGEASISKSYNLRNEQNTENTVTFWDVLIDIDGNENKIPDSELTVRVPANTGKPGVIYSIPAYVVEVETGQRVGGRALSNKADGAYVQSDNITEYIVQTEIDFKELVADGSDTTDLVSAPLAKSLITDRRYYEFTGNAAQNIQIKNLIIPSDVKIRSISVEANTNTGYTSESTEYAYNTASQTLTVHVGAVESGTVFIEFWSK